MFIPVGYTTETHNITAYYEFIEGGLQFGHQQVDTNGDNLQEITQDLLDLFNESEETATPFETWGVTMNDDARVEIRGEFSKEDGKGGYTDEPQPVRIIIQANEK